MELIGKRDFHNRLDSIVLLAVLCNLRRKFTENHFWMVDKVAVDSESVVCLTEVYPVGFYYLRSVTLLQENDVRHHFSTRVFLKSIVRQTYRSEQIRTFRDVFSDFV